MARPLRIEFAGALYHVTSRGNARAAIYLDDGDRRHFLSLLRDVIEECRWRCHAYCLMPNHYHLLLATPEPNLSRGMRQLNGIFTQRFNHIHGRVGHVFQGRFHAVVVERETHLVELARYVVLNPVRAGMVAAAEEYRWSSLRPCLGLEARPEWLSCAPILDEFGSPERYLDFVRAGATALPPWAELKGGVLGSEDFVQGLRPALEPAAEQREFVRRERLAYRMTLADLFPPDVRRNRQRRNARIREAHQSHRYTLSEIARHLGLHYVSIGRIVRSGAARPADVSM